LDYTDRGLDEEDAIALIDETDLPPKTRVSSVHKLSFRFRWGKAFFIGDWRMVIFYLKK
jgi:hypothetical protein